MTSRFAANATPVFPLVLQTAGSADAAILLSSARKYHIVRDAHYFSSTFFVQKKEAKVVVVRLVCRTGRVCGFVVIGSRSRMSYMYLMQFYFMQNLINLV